ncbi:MAG: hypothetical protein ACOCY1_04220 [Halovenus sp.]
MPAGWTDWLPDSDQLGPLGEPPLERRLLDGLRAPVAHCSSISLAPC